MPKYTYGFIDAQYIITTVFHNLKGLKSFNESMLINATFQSFIKQARDAGGVEKLILLWDSWPYHRSAIDEEYKADRVYVSEDDLLDPELTELQRSEITEDLRIDEIKHNSKYWIINHLHEIGIPSITKTGYEADDQALIFSRYNTEIGNHKSVLITSDSDWKYFTTENIDYFHTRRSELYTYDSIRNEMPLIFRDIMSLYEWFAFSDSLEGGHNNLEASINSEWSKKSWSDLGELYIQDPKACLDTVLKSREVFEKNLRTFKVEEFPDYDKVYNRFRYLNTMGSLIESHTLSSWMIEKGVMLNQNSLQEYLSWTNKDLFINE